MNEKLTELQKQLEAATARELPPDTTLDRETAELREGWTAFGELLGAVEYRPDEQLVMRPVRRDVVRRLVFWVAGTALSASLLVGLAVAWNAIWNNHPAPLADAPSDNGADATEIVSHAKDDLPTVDDASGVLPEDVTENAPDTELAWDDSLDEEIAATRERMLYVCRGWDRSEKDFDAVWQGLDEIEQEIAGESL